MKGLQSIMDRKYVLSLIINLLRTNLSREEVFQNHVFQSRLLRTNLSAWRADTTKFSKVKFCKVFFYIQIWLKKNEQVLQSQVSILYLSGIQSYNMSVLVVLSWWQKLACKQAQKPTNKTNTTLHLRHPTENQIQNLNHVIRSRKAMGGTSNYRWLIQEKNFDSVTYINMICTQTTAHAE